MKHNSKFVDFQDYKDKLFMQEKYAELRDVMATMNHELVELRNFMERNQLKTVKSNHRRQRELAKLCRLELKRLAREIKALSSSIEIKECSADVIDIHTKEKKVA